MTDLKPCRRCDRTGTIRDGWDIERCPDCGGYGIEGVARRIEAGQEAIGLLQELLGFGLVKNGKQYIELVKRLAKEFE